MTNKNNQAKWLQLRNGGETRRTFLKKLGVAVGGLGLLHLPPTTRVAQAQSCDADPNEDCAPPGFDTAWPLPNGKTFQPDANLPVRTRKSIWELDSTEQARLREAYKALRSLPESDPRSWLAQARVHCYYCSGSTDDPSQIEIHGGWYFFPWHRAFLYFHERILASLLQDKTFALPYWDWDNPDRMTLPELYGIPNEIAANPLFDLCRQATPTTTQYTLQEWFTDAGIDVAARVQNDDWELFLGTDPNQNGSGGNIEMGPHGLVHLWCGEPSNEKNQGATDMGVLQTAARDPIFFGHHCNIDRLWSGWASLPGHNNPNDQAAQQNWLPQSWSFYDVDLDNPGSQPIWTTITVRDVLDTLNSLRYTYQTEPQPQARAVPVALAVVAEKTTQSSTPTTKTLRLPQAARSQIARGADLVRQMRYILHIDGIVVPADESAIVKVFLNEPDADVKTPTDSPNFVGSFTVVPKTTTGGGHDHKPFNVAFNITDQLPNLLKSSANVTVTLVPVGSPGQAPTQINLTYEKVYIAPLP